MQGKHLYEYAVLRYVPRVEREEFVNVGLAMMCKRERWIKVAVKLPVERIAVFPGVLDCEQIARQLESFVKIGQGDKDAGPVAAYSVEERFRWLTAVKSACIQTSRPHPGLCDDLDSTFLNLFNELVD